MTRSFTDRVVDPQQLDELLDLARRAPSAGFSQGVHFVVLTGDSRRRFWDVSGAGEWFAAQQPGVLRAPVIVLPVGWPDAYTQRYAEPDKAGHGLDVAGNWPVPYWLTDTAMAAQNLLLLCEAHGLGALLFGIFRNAGVLLAELGAPPGAMAIGAIAVGHRDPADVPSGSPRTRTRLPASSVVHHDVW